MAFPKSEDNESTKLMNMFGTDQPDGDDDVSPDGEQGGEGEGDSSPENRAEYSPEHPYYSEQGEDPEGEEGEEGQEGEDQPRGEDGKFKSNKDNPDRFEYWQSKFAKSQEMNERLISELEKRTSAPGNSPEGEKSEPSPQQVLQAKQSELQSLSVPSKPEKPADYSAEDAYTNPDSASFKYRAKMDDYNEQFADVMSKRDSLKDEIYDMKIKSLETPVRKMAQEKQLNAQQKKTVDSLKENYQFNDQQALDFVEMMSKPESMSMDNLVKFYRVTKGVKSPDSKSTTPPEDNRSRKREAAPPIPNGSGAGQSRMNDDDDETELGKAFGEGLLSVNQ